MERALAILRRPLVLAAVLFALTLALYWRTGTFAFLNYDDNVYITDNPAVRAGLGAESVRWAFTSGYAGNWHPLTWLAHMLDVQLFGLDAGAHHRSSALLHALNAALLFAALRALTGAQGKSALVAAFFALHPLRVESVAWISERKDLLSATCTFACLWAYALYARRGGAGRYALSLVLFALALLAKPMAVTVPCLLLVLDVWPLGRVRHPPERGALALVLEKLPFFALAAASAVVTYQVQRAGGAFDPLAGLGLGARAANAAVGYGTYALKTLWPSGLCALHPHPALLGESVGAALGAALAFLVLTTLCLVALRRRAPHALVGWLWFVGTLVPVIGLVQVGAQGWAERYSYLPTIGLVLALVWSADALVHARAARATLAAGAGVALAALAVASARQIETWRDSRALFEHALTVDERSPVAHVNLGDTLFAAGDFAAAERHDARALELAPLLAPVRVNHAKALRALGRNEEARVELERALAADPDMVLAHAELGWLLADPFGRDDEALRHLRRAVELRPDGQALVNNLAWVLATSRTSAAPAEALGLAEWLCRATNDAQAGFLETRAAALARLGQFDEAVRWQTRALELVPGARPIAEHLALYRAGQAFLKTP